MHNEVKVIIRENPTLARMAEAGSSSSPNQPRSKSFKYPVREFGKTKVVRSFQDHWYDSFSWLDYDESKDIVYASYKCVVREVIFPASQD